MPRLAVALAVVLGVALTLPHGVTGAAAQDESPQRVLVFSVPGLTWAESADMPLPALNAFFAEAAVADLAPRSVRFLSRPGDAYLTISSGTRSITDPSVDGLQVAVDEIYAGSPAGEVFARRTGVDPDEPYVALGWPALERANGREPYDAVLGLLADTLHQAGVATAAVANAGGVDSVGPSFERQAGLALVGSDGQLTAGDLSEALLVPDEASAFGVRLDEDQVYDAFRAEWEPPGSEGSVVLVEASDLARTMRYRDVVDATRYEEMRRRALIDSDRLFARLLADVDPERDAVLVVAPYLAGSRDLTVAALRHPGSSPGYLQSATTQRSGVVSLVDVAPTILRTLGIERPTEMEGRAFEVTASGASLEERRDRLVSINAASRFRERLLFPTTLVVVLALGLVAAAAAVVLAGDLSERLRRAVAFAALMTLAALPASYLARAFPLEDLGSGFYWAFLVVAAAAIAAAATWLARRRGQPLLGLATVLVLVLGVPVIDAVTGSNLHLSAAFGYSPTGNSRLYGISNYSFGQLATASCLLAALVAFTWPSRAGRWAALGLLAAALVVLGVPVWGSDVGGVLAFTPTILVFAAILLRYRLRIRGLIVAGLVTLVAVTAFGLVDLARPAEERAHLGRLFERIQDEGLEPLVSIVSRKFVANLRVSTSSFWVAAIPIALLFWLFLRRWYTRPLAGLHRRIPTLHAALAATVTAAVLGSLFNDSGAIVGGVALAVLTASLAYLVVQPTEAA